MIFINTLTFIAGSLITLWLIDSKVVKAKNNVHFYVVRNADYRLTLFLGKPIKSGEHGYYKTCNNGICITTQEHFKSFGLNVDEFKYLKWENDPVEVFVNMKE